MDTFAIFAWICWGIVIGAYAMTVIVDQIEKRQPKTLNLPLDKLQALRPGQVWNVKRDGIDIDIAVLHHSDLEYVVERAAMSLRDQVRVQ